MAAELEVMATGVAIVMGVLALLWGLTNAVGLAVRAGNGIHARANGRTRGATETGEVPAHHLAAIAAAVATVIDAPYRIVRVSAPAHRTPAWAHHGRMTRGTGFRPGNGGPGPRGNERTET